MIQIKTRNAVHFGALKSNTTCESHLIRNKKNRTNATPATHAGRMSAAAAAARRPLAVGGGGVTKRPAAAAWRRRRGPLDDSRALVSICERQTEASCEPNITP